MMPAVKPHRITSRSSPIRKPGPSQPLGWRTVMRWVGSTRSEISTRWIAWTSSTEWVVTGDGSAHQASTGVTA